MSAEDRFYKQLEGIVSSIIKALEGLEKEFSEYIEITNKRLEVLENKAQKMESLADVSGKGLVKAIDTSINPEAVKGLAHLTQQSSPETEPIAIKQQPIIKEEEVYSKPIAYEDPTKIMPEKSIPDIPPVPIPPSVQTPVEEKAIVEKPTEEAVIPQPPKTTETTKEPKKEDKEELMDALKIIDSL